MKSGWAVTLGVLRRIGGAALVLLVVVPFWKSLSSLSAPVAIEAVRVTGTHASLLLRGTIVALLVGGVFALFVAHETFSRPFQAVGDFLVSRGSTAYAAVLGLLSAALTALLSLYLWDLKPMFVDALAQFVHARYFAAGMLAAPAGLPFEHWIVANTFVTEHGWLSQYPPGHTAALAVGFALGAVWLVCPLLMGIAAAVTSLTADRLLPDDRLVARTGALLFALSPFLSLIAASHMSHVTVVALLSIAAYWALRARDGRWPWAAGAGAAVGAAFATRPLSAVTIGAVVTAGVWLTGIAGQRRPVRYMIERCAAALVGALPLVSAVGWYNQRFFGGVLTFGYTAYFGPNHGLGFHPDPLGNPFGPVQGLAYISSDLSTLGYFLLRTPVSAVLVAGLFLLLAARLSTGVKVVTGWALVMVPLLAAYWHHDLLLGPRMLSDAAPAWCLLTAAAALGLARIAPKDTFFIGKRYSPRVLVGTALLASLAVGFGYYLPRDVLSYARTLARPITAPRSDSPRLVFVHDSWDGRISVRLLGSGMRADSVAVALARNSTCTMHEFAVAYEKLKGGDTTVTLPALEFGYAMNDGSRPVTLPSGIVVRQRPGEELGVECLRQVDSDRGGTVPLMPIVWQGDLPGIPGSGAMFVRDLGPAANTRLLERFPRRRPAMLYQRPDDRALTLAPYDVGITDLWGGGAPNGGAVGGELPR